MCLEGHASPPTPMNKAVSGGPPGMAIFGDYFNRNTERL